MAHVIEVQEMQLQKAHKRWLKCSFSKSTLGHDNQKTDIFLRSANSRNAFFLDKKYNL